jgi:hypothetical protein
MKPQPTRPRSCGRVLRAARESFIEVQQFRLGDASVNYRIACHPLRNAARMPRRFAPGHKKTRSDPPGRDTHSYDNGLNTQDSVTQVNPFSAISHAPAGTDHCKCAAPGRRRRDIVRMKR